MMSSICKGICLIVYSVDLYHRAYAEELRKKSLEVLSSLSNPRAEEDLNYAAHRVYGKGYSGATIKHPSDLTTSVFDVYTIELKSS
jgi:hypothetical protein